MLFLRNRGWLYLCAMQKIFGEEALQEVAVWFWQQIQSHKVVALYGPMGVGKTTLVQAICNQFNVIDTVSSPTFSIINEYRYEKEGSGHTIYHIDLYRIKDEEEAIRAGVEDCLYSNSLCFVEWPERAPHIFPANTLQVFLSLAGDNKRQIEIREK